MDQVRKPADTGHDAVAAKVVHALRRLSRAMELHSRFLEARYGLTVPQLTVLKELSEHDAATVSALAKAVHLSQATVTGILDRLERRGLVHRRRSERDKRRVLVHLAVDGRRMLDRGPPLLQECFSREFRKLPERRRTEMLSDLQEVVAMMEAGPILPAEARPTGWTAASPLMGMDDHAGPGGEGEARPAAGAETAGK
jgi:DNA-binding MarR family transcriptional regulator